MESHVTGSSAIMSESNRACNLHSWLLAAPQCVHSQKHVCCTRCKRIPQSSNLLATDENNRPKWPRSIVRDPRHQTSPLLQDTILNFFIFFLNRRFSFPSNDHRPKSFARKWSIFSVVLDYKYLLFDSRIVEEIVERSIYVFTRKMFKKKITNWKGSFSLKFNFQLIDNSKRNLKIWTSFQSQSNWPMVNVRREIQTTARLLARIT